MVWGFTPDVGLFGIEDLCASFGALQREGVNVYGQQVRTVRSARGWGTGPGGAALGGGRGLRGGDAPLTHLFHRQRRQQRLGEERRNRRTHTAENTHSRNFLESLSPLAQVGVTTRYIFRANII